MQAAKKILAHSQALEGAVAVRLLQHEIINIERALLTLRGKRKVSHTIALPYGTIQLTIEGRRRMSDDKKHTELLPGPKGTLFKPTAEDIFEDVFSDLDEKQARQIKGQAAEEAMRLVAEKKRSEAKFANASKDLGNFVANADLMESRKKDYRMSG